MKKDEKNSSPAKLSISDSFTAKVIDRFLDYLKKASWSGRILKSEALCGSVGLYGIYFIGVMGFVFVLCLPLKIPGFGFGSGIAGRNLRFVGRGLFEFCRL